MFFKKPPRDSQPMPPWLKLGVIVFVLLAFGMHSMGIRPPASAVNNGMAGSSGQMNWGGLPSLETYKSRLMPGYDRLQIKEDAPGQGGQATCGQDVDIRYRESTFVPTSPVQKQQPKPAPGEIKPLHFRLGAPDVPRTLQEGVIGMREGGKREMLVPAERTATAQGAEHYDIELLKALPPLPQIDPHTLSLRSFDRQIGMARPVRCGDTVKAHLKIWAMSGAVLLDTHEGKGEPLSLQTGSGSMMLGLETGLLGMLGDGQRTLIIPPALQKPLRPAAAGDKKSAGTAPDILGTLALPPQQAIIVDVDLVH